MGQQAQWKEKLRTSKVGMEKWKTMENFEEPTLKAHQKKNPTNQPTTKEMRLYFMAWDLINCKDLQFLLNRIREWGKKEEISWRW